MARSAADALVDTNVLVASLDEDHAHHGWSLEVLINSRPGSLAVSSHCLAETYSTLTRSDRAAQFRWPADRALEAVSVVAARLLVVGLTPAQTLEAVVRFGVSGGVGPRIYDFLIGEAARHANLRRIITWNTGHFRSLFPGMDVLTPVEVLA